MVSIMDVTIPKKFYHCLIFNLTLIEIVLSGNVLIWPTDGSHWLNIKMILEELNQRKHNVTVLASSATLFINSNSDSPVNFEVIPVSYKKSNIDSLIEHMIMLWIDHRPTPLTLWAFYKELGKLLDTFFRINIQICDGVLNNPKLMARLQKSRFDVLLADPVTICGDLVALKLGIPFMYTLRFSPASTVERHCGKVPAPVSYVPAALSELTDQMTFGERLKNTISYPLQDYIFQSYWGEWNSYYSKVLGKSLKCSLHNASRYFIYSYCWYSKRFPYHCKCQAEVNMHGLSHFGHIWLFVAPWTVTRQAPLSMGFSRQEYCSVLPSHPPGDVPHPGIKPLSLMSPTLAGGFFTTTYYILYMCTQLNVIFGKFLNNGMVVLIFMILFQTNSLVPV